MELYTLKVWIVWSVIYMPIKLLKKRVSQLKTYWLLPTKWCIFQLHEHHIYYRYLKNWKQILYTGYPTFPPKYVLGTYFDPSTMVDAVEIQRRGRHVPSFEKLTIWLFPSAWLLAAVVCRWYQLFFSPVQINITNFTELRAAVKIIKRLEEFCKKSY